MVPQNAAAAVNTILREAVMLHYKSVSCSWQKCLSFYLDMNTLYLVFGQIQIVPLSGVIIC